MPLFTVLILTAACLPLWGGESPLGLGPRDSALATAASLAVPLLLAFALRTWVVWAVGRDPDGRVGIARAYARVRRGLFVVNVGAVGLAVGVFGWGHAVQTTLVADHDVEYVSPSTGAVVHARGPDLLPFAELAVPLPYFVLLAGLWVVYYDADRALDRAARRGRPYWTRGGYLLNHARQLTLVALPVVLFAAYQSVARWVPAARTDWFKALSLLAVPAVAVVFPVIVRPLLGLRPLPPGPARDRLAALAARLRFRYADLLVWPTRGAAVNAMVAGLVGRLRYVVFTDRMLDDMPPDELDAVFGHEAGHARHGHLWYYALFLALSMTAVAAATAFAEGRIKHAFPGTYHSLPPEYQPWVLLPPLVVTGAYLFVVFGHLSRRCERQADVFGARAVSCGNPACTGHDETTVYPPGATALCPTGLQTMAHALELVELYNGHSGRPRGGVKGVLAWVRAWQHSTIPRRAAYLRGLIADPARERRMQRGVTVLRWGLVAGLLAATVGFGQLVGWRNLLAEL